MNKSLKLSIFEVVGSPFCVASSDGQKVYERLSAALKEEKSITISFYNVTTLTSAFLNSAIGQLYGAFPEETIRSLLKVEDIQEEDLLLLKHVIETAKLYFKDPKKFDQAAQKALGGSDDT